MAPEVASWLMLAEGIAQFASGDHLAARDRVRRADGLAVALNTRPAKATCAAWLANIEFNLSNFEEMVPLLDRAFDEAASDDHQALGRACLTMADAYHYSGSFTFARPWYDRARLHATAEGDETMLSAVLNNVAAFRAVNVLLGHALGECLPEESQRAKMEASSAASYDSVTGPHSFESLSSLLAGQLLLVEGDLQGAFNRLLAVKSTTVPKRLWPVLHSDIGWCACALGLTEQSMSYCRMALSEMSPGVDDDDAAYVWARLSSVERTFGDFDKATEMSQRANAAMSRLQSLRLSLRQRLDACQVNAPSDRTP